MAQAVRGALLGHLCQRHNCLPHGQGGGGIICAYPAGLAGRHPEPVPHEPPAAAVQDGRTPHPACPVLHPATCRKLLDGEPLSSDSSAHRSGSHGIRRDRELHPGAEAMRSSAARRGGVSGQGRRIYHSPKREAADGPCVASVTALNLLERMNELRNGVIRPFNATRERRRGSISEVPAHKEGTRMKRVAEILTVSLIGGLLPLSTMAAADDACEGLPSHAALRGALATATAAEASGLNNNMWAAIVNRDGIVCAVAFSGANRGAQWPGSRVISAQKANTANAFSLDSSSFSNGSGQSAGLALSTANLYSAVNPGGSLYGLQHSNPVNPAVAYAGDPELYGADEDPMVGKRIGGVNVFGGGLALYANRHVIAGGLGVSGDTSCADHNIAWRTRNLLGLDHLAASGSLPAVH